MAKTKILEAYKCKIYFANYKGGLDSRVPLPVTELCS